MNITVEVKLNTEKLQELQRKLGDKRRQANLLDTLANAIRDEAVRIVPVGKTGNLRASIQVGAPAENVRLIGVSPQWDVGGASGYARFVEFGTRYMSARPYLFPSAERVLKAGNLWATAREVYLGRGR